MTSCHDRGQDGPTPTAPPPGREDHAWTALNELERTDGDTPPAVAIARGMRAVTCAVLALREAADDNAVLIAGEITETAGYVCDVAGAIDEAAWPAWLRQMAQRLALPWPAYRTARRRRCREGGRS